MLGRHVYRVSPLHNGGWQILKEGERGPRARRVTREEAVSYATRLAAADAPSKVIIEAEEGMIGEERVFGDDMITELDRATGHSDSIKYESDK